MNYLQIALSYRRVCGLALLSEESRSACRLFATSFPGSPLLTGLEESVKNVMPGGMAATFVAMLALVFYGLICRSDSGIAEDAGAAAN